MPRSIHILAIFAALFSLVAGSVALAEDLSPGLKTQTEKQTTSKWPEELGPLVLGDPGGPASMRIALAMQAIYQMDVEEVQTRDAKVGGYGGKFRRLRFVFSGHLGVPNLTWNLHLSTLPSSLELMDLWLQYKINDWFSIRAGNIKIPFTRYRNNSFKSLSMVDWGIVTSYFGAERQKGIVLHNGYGKNAGFEYEFGIFTGVAARPPHAKGMADIYGESVPNPSDLTGPALNERLHPEIVLHLAYNHGAFGHAPEADIEGGPLRLSAGLSVAWDTRPVRATDVSLRIAPELWIKVMGFHFQATGYVGFAELGSEMSDTAFALVGAVSGLGYTYKDVMDFSLQYAMVASSEALRADALDRASRIIAQAETGTEFVDLMRQYASAGSFESRHELSFALSVFIIGQNLRWVSDLAWIATTRDGIEAQEIRFRSQLQLEF
jgi:hypothetical protein